MAGIFQSMLYGMNQARAEQRQKREDEYIEGERAYQQERRGVVDSREDQTWADSREDRTYLIETLRPMETESARLDLQSKSWEVNRQPIEAAQRDQQFDVQMESARQGIVAGELQIGSARRAAQIEEAQQPAKLEEIQMERARRMALDELAKTGQQFMLAGQQGKKQDAAQMLNQLWARVTNDPDGDAGVRVNDQGGYYIEGPDRQPVLMLGDEDKALEYAFTFLSDPATFGQSWQGIQAARAQAAAKEAEARATYPQRFVETMQQPDGTVAMVDRVTGTARPVTDAQGRPVQGTVQGAGGSIPAKLQVAQAYLQNMQRRPGESEGDAWIRAFHESNQRSEVSPTAAARDFYASTLRALTQNAYGTRGQEAALQTAAQMTQEYMQRFYPGAELPLEDLAQIEADMVPAQPQQQSASGLLGQVSPTLGLATNVAARLVGATQGQQSARPAPASAASAAPYPDGTELQGPDGRTYIVRNGQPVPKQ